MPLKTVRAIEIELFINASREAEGVQFVKQAYYLEPEQIGAKAFYLLKSVLAEQNKTRHLRRSCSRTASSSRRSTRTARRCC